MEVNKMLHYKNLSLGDIIYELDGVKCIERWEDINGYEGHYKISDLGRVKSLKRLVPHSKSGFITKEEKLLKQKSRKRGDLEVNLALHSKHNTKLVHRLVAAAFIDNPHKLPEVNHKEGVVFDNRFFKLEWVTPSENQLHSYRVLNRKKPDLHGVKNPNYGNYRLYLDLVNGIYYNTKELQDLLSLTRSGLNSSLYRGSKKTKNFITV